MPEMPRWVIILVMVLFGWFILNQVTSFVSKVGTTVNKANTSMERDNGELSKINQ